MAVAITASKTVQGSAVADNLAVPSGSATGADIGSVQNGAYAPLINQTANTGVYDLYFRHDAAIDPITNCVTFIGEYGVGSGNAYGGAKNASQDIADVLALGAASDGNKNNLASPSKLGGGIRIDMDADQADINRFDWDTNGLGEGGNDTVAIYGKDHTNFSNLDGSDLANGFPCMAAALMYDTGGGVPGVPSAPVQGTIGRSSDAPEAALLGSDFKASLRAYLPEAHPDGGVVQVDYYLGFSFTA